MKKNRSAYFVTMALFAALAIPVGAAPNSQPHQAHHYQLVDLGTFGGPNSFYYSEPVQRSVNNLGLVTGLADTPDADPDCAIACFGDGFVTRAFVWRDGTLVDLGVLPGGYNSAATAISDGGSIDGGADNGLIDPVSGLPAQHAVVWSHGQIADLGTLGGAFSYANAMNNRGQVVGIALNETPDDPFSYIGSFLGVADDTQTHAFLWQEGVISDLGTLGGPDSWGDNVNDFGQVSGWSYTNSTVIPTTGVPTQHPFLWSWGKLTDLGTLGGTYAVTGSLQYSGGGSINDWGQVIGTSNLAGDATYHPFLWSQGRMTDLGTLGGANGEAFWINNLGEVVGRGDISGSTNHHATLWRNGTVTDLGSAPGWPCSTAYQINERSQIIFGTGICGQGGGPAFLWENGVAYNLNTLVQSGSGFYIDDVNYINERGEIAATGVLSNGDQHDLLLIPCDENHPGVEGCDYSLVDASTAPEAGSARVRKPLPGRAESDNPPLGPRRIFSARFAHRFPGSGPQK